MFPMCNICVGTTHPVFIWLSTVFLCPKGVIYIAIYHCSIKIISRGKGKSAVVAAAYRSGEKLTNQYDGIVHDYTRKGGVVHAQ